MNIVLKMGHTHDVIESLAVAFASDAWTLLGQKKPGLSGSLVLSPPKSFDFVTLSIGLNCSSIFSEVVKSNRMVFSKADRPNGFFSKHPPWENEQLACVHDFLGKKVSDGKSINNEYKLIYYNYTFFSTFI